MNKKLITLYLMCFFVACDSSTPAQDPVDGKVTPSTQNVAGTLPLNQESTTGETALDQKSTSGAKTPQVSLIQKCEPFKNCQSIFVYKPNNTILKEFIVLESNQQSFTLSEDKSVSYFASLSIYVFEKKNYSPGISRIRNMTAGSVLTVRQKFCKNKTELDLLTYINNHFLPLGSMTFINTTKNTVENIFSLPANDIAQSSQIVNFEKKKKGLLQTITFMDSNDQKFTINKHQEISPIYVTMNQAIDFYRYGKRISKLDDLLKRQQEGDPLDAKIAPTELCTEIEIV